MSQDLGSERLCRALRAVLSLATHRGRIANVRAEEALEVLLHASNGAPQALLPEDLMLELSNAVAEQAASDNRARVDLVLRTLLLVMSSSDGKFVRQQQVRMQRFEHSCQLALHRCHAVCP
jgi:hypothetical protein